MPGASRTIHYGVTVACAWLVLSAAVGAQAPGPSPDQQRVLQMLDVLARAPLGDTARDIRWLRESVLKLPNASLPPAVLAGLDADLTALHRINELPEAQRQPVLDAVRADLALKARVLPESSRRNGRAGGAECAHMAGRQSPLGVSAVAGDVHQRAACGIPRPEAHAVPAIQLADVPGASTGCVRHLGARSEERGAAWSGTSRKAWGGQGSHARRGSARCAGFLSSDAV